MIKWKLYGIAGVVLALAFAGTWWGGTKIGYANARADYNEETAKVVEQALKKQKELQDKLNEKAHEYVKESQATERRIEDLQRELRSKLRDIQMRDDIISDLRVPADIIGMLNSLCHSAGSGCADKPYFDKPSTEITTLDLIEYIAEVIKHDNMIMAQLLGLIEAVNVVAAESLKASQVR